MKDVRGISRDIIGVLVGAGLVLCLQMNLDGGLRGEEETSLGGVQSQIEEGLVEEIQKLDRGDLLRLRAKFKTLLRFLVKVKTLPGDFNPSSPPANLSVLMDNPSLLAYLKTQERLRDEVFSSVAWRAKELQEPEAVVFREAVDAVYERIRETARKLSRSKPGTRSYYVNRAILEISMSHSTELSHFVLSGREGGKNAKGEDVTFLDPRTHGSLQKRFMEIIRLRNHELQNFSVGFLPVAGIKNKRKDIEEVVQIGHRTANRDLWLIPVTTLGGIAVFRAVMGGCEKYLVSIANKSKGGKNKMGRFLERHPRFDRYFLPALFWAVGSWLLIGSADSVADMVMDYESKVAISSNIASDVRQIRNFNQEGYSSKVVVAMFYLALKGKEIDNMVALYPQWKGQKAQAEQKWGSLDSAITKYRGLLDMIDTRLRRTPDFQEP